MEPYVASYVAAAVRPYAGHRSSIGTYAAARVLATAIYVPRVNYGLQSGASSNSWHW